MELAVLSPDQAGPYRKLTYPSYRDIITDATIPDGEHPLVMGAGENGQPAGLIVMARDKSRKTGRLASLFVQESHRRRGIGTALIRHAMAAMRAEGIERLEAEYCALPRIAAFEGVLGKAGWNPPAVHSHYYRFELKHLAQARWMRRLRAPARYHIVPWQNVPKAQLAPMAALRETGYLPYYEPLWNQEKIAGACSHVLFNGDEVAGWSIVEQHVPDTLLYRALYIREASRHRGLGLALAARTAVSAFESAVLCGVIQIAAHNHDMQNIARHIIMPLHPAITEYRTCQYQAG